MFLGTIKLTMMQQMHLDWPTFPTITTMIVEIKHWLKSHIRCLERLLWIANTLVDFFCSHMIRTSRRHLANSKNVAVWKNAWNSEKLNSNDGQKYPQCIANILILQVDCVSKETPRERLRNRTIIFGWGF